MKFNSGFLQTYLEFVEDTESPRIFHVWSALSGISASLGRRCILPFGIGPIYPNMYILLVGPPAVRKSTALNIVRRMVKKSTGIKFAPSDTGGQRQGLIKAMENDREERELFNGIDLDHVNGMTLDEFGGLGFSVHPEDKHHIYVVASEFNTFIGHNSLNMITFLTKTYDGEDYDYQLKDSAMILKNPLVNMLGGTTPTNIATALPQEAIGQGFMSRIIMAYDNQKYKNVPRPVELDRKTQQFLEETFGFIYTSLEGEFQESAEAKKAIDDLYNDKPAFNDTRFIYYMERRHQHLIKTTMAIAAADRRLIIYPKDVEDAHQLLVKTEKTMSSALGEYGMSPISAAKQKMLEFLVNAHAPVSDSLLWAMMSRDMKPVDFNNSIADLINSNKVQRVTLKTGPALVAKEFIEASLMDRLMRVDEAEDGEEREFDA